MPYIHQQPDWPEFIRDREPLLKPITTLHHKKGKHLGRMEALGFDLRTEANLTALTDEVVKSSAIEGEQLDPEDVR